jgi:hypothetical protein
MKLLDCDIVLSVEAADKQCEVLDVGDIRMHVEALSNDLTRSPGRFDPQGTTRSVCLVENPNAQLLYTLPSPIRTESPRHVHDIQLVRPAREIAHLPAPHLTRPVILLEVNNNAPRTYWSSQMRTGVRRRARFG